MVVSVHCISSVLILSDPPLCFFLRYDPLLLTPLYHLQMPFRNSRRTGFLPYAGTSMLLGLQSSPTEELSIRWSESCVNMMIPPKIKENERGQWNNTPRGPLLFLLSQRWRVAHVLWGKVAVQHAEGPPLGAVSDNGGRSQVSSLSDMFWKWSLQFLLEAT